MTFLSSFRARHPIVQELLVVLRFSGVDINVGGIIFGYVTPLDAIVEKLVEEEKNQRQTNPILQQMSYTHLSEYDAEWVWHAWVTFRVWYGVSPPPDLMTSLTIEALCVDPEKDDISFVWTGDLNDDCSCVWKGLLLRAECMDGSYWWWAVTSEQGESIQSEYDLNSTFPRTRNGKDARLFAQMVATHYHKHRTPLVYLSHIRDIKDL